MRALIHQQDETGMQKGVIVFDLDGTLVDTAPDLLDSLNHCLATVALPPVDEIQLRRYVGMGGKVMIERAFGGAGRHIGTGELEKLHDVFLRHYTDGMPGRSLPFPGVETAMGRFADAGFLLAVCTNKLEGLSRSLLDGLKLSDRFAAICGSDTFAMRKPDPRHLTETIRLAGGDPARSVMIGDSRTDIDTAKAAGIPVVAVDFGYTDQHVSVYEPSGVISHFDDLSLAMIEDLLMAAAGRSRP
jgi:phosphoglycolate phosphatase